LDKPDAFVTLVAIPPTNGAIIGNKFFGKRGDHFLNKAINKGMITEIIGRSCVTRAADVVELPVIEGAPFVPAAKPAKIFVIRLRTLFFNDLT
jgi:hypothetical protein